MTFHDAPPTTMATPPGAALPAGRAGAGAAVVVAAASAGAGLIHAAMAPAHVAEWAAEGRGFAALAAAQLLVAALLVTRPRRSSYALAALVQLPAVVGWAWSRTSGLPWGPTPKVAEAVGWIDAVCTGLEVVAIVLAVRLLLGAGAGRAAEARADRLPVPTWAAVAGVVAIGGSALLVGSPEGQHDHAGGHSHGATVTLTEPLPRAVRTELADELTVSRAITMKYPTVADAKAAGLQLAGQFVPGSAAHYVDIEVGMATTFDLERPLAWLYSGTDDDSVVVGVMYYLATDQAPEGFAGPLDVWHQHTGACYVARDDGELFVPFSPDHDGTKAECDEFQGNFITQTGWMVHVWDAPGWESPLGVFSHDHPELLCADGRSTVDDQAKGCQGT